MVGLLSFSVTYFVLSNYEDCVGPGGGQTYWNVKKKINGTVELMNVFRNKCNMFFLGIC